MYSNIFFFIFFRNKKIEECIYSQNLFIVDKFNVMLDINIAIILYPASLLKVNFFTCVFEGFCLIGAFVFCGTLELSDSMILKSFIQMFLYKVD